MRPIPLDRIFADFIFKDTVEFESCFFLPIFRTFAKAHFFEQPDFVNPCFLPHAKTGDDGASRLFHQAGRKRSR